MVSVNNAHEPLVQHVECFNQKIQSLNICMELKQISKLDVIGIYFLIKNKKCVYVGKTTNLYSRPFQHIHGGKDYDLIHTLVAPESCLDLLESAFVGLLLPEYNGGINKNKNKKLSTDWNVLREVAFNNPEFTLKLYSELSQQQFQDEKVRPINEDSLYIMLENELSKIVVNRNNQKDEKRVIKRSKIKTNLCFSQEVREMGERLAKNNGLTLSAYLTTLIIQQSDKNTCP